MATNEQSVEFTPKGGFREVLEGLNERRASPGKRLVCNQGQVDLNIPVAVTFSYENGDMKIRAVNGRTTKGTPLPLYRADGPERLVGLVYQGHLGTCDLVRIYLDTRLDEVVIAVDNELSRIALRAASPVAL